MNESNQSIPPSILPTKNHSFMSLSQSRVICYLFLLLVFFFSHKIDPRLTMMPCSPFTIYRQSTWYFGVFALGDDIQSIWSNLKTYSNTQPYISVRYPHTSAFILTVPTIALALALALALPLPLQKKKRKKRDIDEKRRSNYYYNSIIIDLIIAVL